MNDYDRPIALAGVLKVISPPVIRPYLRAAHKRYVFRRAIREFLRDPKKITYPWSALIGDLIYGWANEGWSPSPEFISACVQHALATNGAVLECGSGLTTILLGAIAKPQARTVWTLENSQEWGERVNGILHTNGIDCVRLCIRPLKQFGEFSWYDPPLHEMPNFSLVVCDGPPSHVPGGRYGLLPVMKQKLSNRAIVLLDDAARERERRIAVRWASEFGMTYELLGSDRPFVRLTLPEIEPSRLAAEARQLGELEV